MKKSILIFALPLLLALAPMAASAARILWIGIDETAVVVDKDGVETPIYQFQSSDKAINAAKVSVEGEGGAASTYLLFAYDDGGSIVTDDPDSHTLALPPDSPGSGSGSGSGSGTGQTSGLDAGWLAAVLGDNYDNADSDTEVTLELGYVDWAAVDEAYNNDPTGLTVTFDFERLAFATSTIGDLQTAYHISPLASTASPRETPWKPDKFIAVPEPSVCCTALLGVFLLAKRRKARPASAAQSIVPGPERRRRV